METTTTTNTDLGYGFKKDGSPKQRPGKKASAATLKSFFVMDGVPITGKGRPSTEEIRNRRLVTMPKHENYDSNIHGLGERQAVDDLMVQVMEARQANKPVKAAKTVAADVTPEPSPATENHNVEVTLDNSAVSTSIALGVESEMVAV